MSILGRVASPLLYLFPAISLAQDVLIQGKTSYCPGDNASFNCTSSEGTEHYWMVFNGTSSESCTVPVSGESQSMNCNRLFLRDLSEQRASSFKSSLTFTVAPWDDEVSVQCSAEFLKGDECSQGQCARVVLMFPYEPPLAPILDIVTTEQCDTIRIGWRGRPSEFTTQYSIWGFTETPGQCRGKNCQFLKSVGAEGVETIHPVDALTYQLGVSAAHCGGSNASSITRSFLPGAPHIKEVRTLACDTVYVDWTANNNLPQPEKYQLFIDSIPGAFCNTSNRGCDVIIPDAGATDQITIQLLSMGLCGLSTPGTQLSLDLNKLRPSPDGLSVCVVYEEGSEVGSIVRLSWHKPDGEMLSGYQLDWVSAHQKGGRQLHSEMTETELDLIPSQYNFTLMALYAGKSDNCISNPEQALMVDVPDQPMTAQIYEGDSGPVMLLNHMPEGNTCSVRVTNNGVALEAECEMLSANSAQVLLEGLAYNQAYNYTVMSEGQSGCFQTSGQIRTAPEPSCTVLTYTTLLPPPTSSPSCPPCVVPDPEDESGQFCMTHLYFGLSFSAAVVGGLVAGSIIGALATWFVVHKAYKQAASYSVAAMRGARGSGGGVQVIELDSINSNPVPPQESLYAEPTVSNYIEPVSGSGSQPSVSPNAVNHQYSEIKPLSPPPVPANQPVHYDEPPNSPAHQNWFDNLESP